MSIAATAARCDPAPPAIAVEDPVMRSIAVAALISLALTGSPQAEDAFRYRQLGFGNALAAGHISACSIDFDITFQDPRASPPPDDSLHGEFVFSRPHGQLSVSMTLDAFGDFSTKFTGIGDISDVSFGDGDIVLRLKPSSRTSDGSEPALPPDRTEQLLSVLNAESTLRFTLSRPIRSFTMPFSLHDVMPRGSNQDLAVAGRGIFDDCIASLASTPP